MRSKGSKTEVLCWRLEVVNQNEIIYTNEYKTLNEVATELGITYNQVVEMSSGRKKQLKGRFDTSYRFIKINKKKCQEEKESAEKLNTETSELKEQTEEKVVE